MVGPFMQGVLLMGIIYWYSKSMLSLINDYYRSEIQRKISSDGPVDESSEFINVDQIVEYHLENVKNESERQERIVVGSIIEENVEINDTGGAEWFEMSNSKVGDLKFLMERDVCRRTTRLEEFYKIVARKILHIDVCRIRQNWHKEGEEGQI